MPLIVVLLVAAALVGLVELGMFVGWLGLEAALLSKDDFPE